jgi:hypothetical protein
MPLRVLGKGVGFAATAIDYGQEHNLIWVISFGSIGAIWCASNPQVRIEGIGRWAGRGLDFSKTMANQTARSAQARSRRPCQWRKNEQRSGGSGRSNRRDDPSPRDDRQRRPIFAPGVARGDPRRSRPSSPPCRVRGHPGRDHRLGGLSEFYRVLRAIRGRRGHRTRSEQLACGRPGGVGLKATVSRSSEVLACLTPRQRASQARGALRGRGVSAGGRGLDRLLGKDVTEGRQFFIGRRAGTGEAWRSYLAQLSTAPPEPSVRAEIIKGAVDTFAAFEHWLNGWSTSSHG